MVPYTGPKRSDLYTLSQSKLLENHTLHSGTYLCSPYMAVPLPGSIAYIQISNTYLQEFLNILSSVEANRV